jgi:hypothetical protein
VIVGSASRQVIPDQVDHLLDLLGTESHESGIDQY